jgi:hypothetical protein
VSVQVADSKAVVVAGAMGVVASNRLVVETVAGSGEKGDADGALSACKFGQPMALCRFGESLIVCDLASLTIRLVDGVLGVADPLADSKVTGASR